MKRSLLLLVCLAALLSACKPELDLTFLQEDDTFVLPAEMFDIYARAISKADRQTAIDLIDKGYAIADSLSACGAYNKTLFRFADGMAEYFFAVDAPYRNEEIYALALEREGRCQTMEPDDFKRLAWKKGILQKNAPGRMIADIPLQSESGDTVSLRSVIDRKSVIFIYGEQCKTCSELVSGIRKSGVVRKALQDSSVRFISIFAGDDTVEFPETAGKLEGWDNFIDAFSSVIYSNSFDSRMIPSLYAVTSNGVVKIRGSLDINEIEKFITEQTPQTVSIALNPGERIWGGRIADGTSMPYADGFSTTMHANNGNQVQPLLLSSEGRYVWCNDPFDFCVRNDSLILSALTSEVETAVVGRSLYDAFQYASKTYFPADGQLPPVEFFEMPQYNTWVELIYNQNQADVLNYARNIVKHGLPAGIIMIDDTWMEDYGKWRFHPGRFPDPKKMCDELHAMGFKLMLWVCPFVSMDQYEIWSTLCARDAFIKTEQGRTYPVEWWNGYSASLDFSNPAALDWFDEQLHYLMDEYGVDGFKFDAGDFNLWPDDGVNYAGEKNYQLCEDFVRYAARYPFNELRAGWKNGGRPIINRLHDKTHSWEANQALIPEMMAESLMGYYFACPDMVGGGSFASFLPGCEIDQDIVVRSAQTHALMPMMQFSVAPWRVLDKTHLDAVLQSVKIRQSYLPLIKDLMAEAAAKGEPVVTPMEYRFPHQGFEEVVDQFVLGRNIIVAPMVYPGTKRNVVLPEGRWTADDGTVYQGGQIIEIEVPLERIPVFRFSYR